MPSLKIVTSGMKLTLVPCPSAVADRLDRPLRLAGAVLLPLQLAARLRTSIRIQVESALTTLRPTPCRPDETLYESASNLPPACSTVAASSKPETFLVGCRSTGMPRPLSDTVTEPSAWMMMSI